MVTGRVHVHDVPLFLLDRLTQLATRVTNLEAQLTQEKNRTEHFEVVSIVYREELKTAREKIENFELKLSRIRKWKALFNRLV